MYKVSFKDDFKKVERFNNKVTKVTLKGSINDHYTPNGLDVPRPIIDWMIDSWGDTDTIKVIEVSGIAIRSNKDKDDPVLGERLAEARAKHKIYKFMRTFCHKMLKYYALKLYGINTNNTITVRAIDQESYVDSLQKAYKKYSRLVDVENTHIKQLLYDY